MKKKKALPVRRERLEMRRAGVHAPQWLERAAADAPRAMLCGRGYLVVENCGCVTEFDPERVCLATTAGVMCIRGSELSLSRENGHTAVVCGRIDRIGFENGDA